ncbi:TPA: tautomerase family protein [Streptococcus agalactiae]|nr:tautomerase family protein [Streptococcus agalactiae]
MPFVKIDLFEGRSQEQKNELAREVTQVTSFDSLCKHIS